MTKQIGNYKAILTAISVQFIVLPFFGFLVVRYLGLEYPEGISLLIITTSPGGSYSNW
jgi:predicted Na+-dependent transporter